MTSSCSALLQKFRGSRRLVLLIVAIALLLDNMLLSTIVPIIPTFLYQLNHAHHVKPSNISKRTTFAPSSSVPTTRPFHTENSLSLYETSFSSQEFENLTTGRGQKWKFSGEPPAISTQRPKTTLSADMTKQRHEELVDENVEVGIMFASKPIVQAITNPFVGFLTNRIGYSIPMFTGFVIMFISTIIFAVGNSYTILFVARALQGIGSACTSVAGMGILAVYYQDDRERGNAMGLALGGLAMGVMIGPPFGGVLYQFVSRAAPFLILAALALVDGVFQLVVLRPKVTKKEEEGPTLISLIKDPYVLIAAGGITFANMGIATLEPSLPLWMMDTMNAPKWQQGIAFLPASLSYLVGTNIFGPLGHRMGRWLSAMVGIVTMGVCLIAIPFAKNILHLIAPAAGIGFSIGMVDASMFPMLGYLVDIRHTPVYGSVYAIGDVAFCVGFAVGPLLSGVIVKALGFRGLAWFLAACCLLYAPFLLFLRNPPERNQGKRSQSGANAPEMQQNNLSDLGKRSDQSQERKYSTEETVLNWPVVGRDVHPMKYTEEKIILGRNIENPK